MTHGGPLQQFTTIDVNGSMMTAMIGRYAVAEAARAALSLKDAAWNLHPMQEDIIVNLGMAVEPMTAMADNARPLKTFCGFPMMVSEKMPKDEINLRTFSGEILAKIKNLGMLDGNVPRGT